MKWKEEHAKVSKDLATEQAIGVKLEIGDPLWLSRTSLR